MGALHLKSAPAPADPATGAPLVSEQTRDTEEMIEILERKLGILKREYEQYFLGTRPREPVLTRGEVQKLVVLLSNTHIGNTAQRFKFSSICSRPD